MIIHRGIDIRRLARHIGPHLIVLLAYDVIVTYLYVGVGWQWVSVDNLPLPLLGSAIALIVTFRNNAAYDRWWEARTLWGAVVNNSRSFARCLIAMTGDPALQARLIRHQIAYALTLRCHLLRKPSGDVLERYLPDGTAARLRSVANVPAAIQNAIARELASARDRQVVDGFGIAALDRVLGDLANAQGGLERIKNTPLPRQYSHFPQVFTRVYCLLLPVGLVHDLGYVTPIGSTVIGFMFLALDRIGRDLEDPFEATLHDIPMRAITRSIEIDLLQTINGMGHDTAVPNPVEAKDGVLW